GQVVKLESHGIPEVFFENYAANSFGHGILPCSRLLSVFGRIRCAVSGSGGIHMTLQRLFGCDQPLGDQGLAILESLARHRYRYGDCITEWIVQRHSNGADSKRVFFAVIGDAGTAGGVLVAGTGERARPCVFAAGAPRAPAPATRGI